MTPLNTFLSVLFLHGLDDMNVLTSTTLNPKQVLHMTVTIIDGKTSKENIITGVRDCILYYGDRTENIILLAEGKSLRDERNKELGEGQLLMAMLTTFQNPVWGCILTPKRYILLELRSGDWDEVFTVCAKIKVYNGKVMTLVTFMTMCPPCEDFHDLSSQTVQHSPKSLTASQVL